MQLIGQPINSHLECIKYLTHNSKKTLITG
jgi:hypothetical protein